MAVTPRSFTLPSTSIAVVPQLQVKAIWLPDA